MAFDYEIVTDSSSNIPKSIIEKYNLPILPFKYTMDGKDYFVDLMSGPLERQAFFAAMRIKVEVTTSLVNFAEYTDVFEKILLEGRDILYIGMAAGITLASAAILSMYPDVSRRMMRDSRRAAKFTRRAVTRALG